MLLARTRNRNLFLSIILAFGLFGLGTVSCTTEENVIGGTGLGAAFGAGIGALVGDPGIGAAIGAGVGAMGGLTKDSIEKGQQNKANQAQNDARLRQLEINAEIDRQVSVLQGQGYTPEEYEYRATTTVSGMIVVDPIKKTDKAVTRVYR